MHLSARIARDPGGRQYIGRITAGQDLPLELRGNEILLFRAGADTEGYAGVLAARYETPPGRYQCLPTELDYLSDGDIVRINEPAGEIRVMYRKNSQHNVLFFTERCNSRCLMCSQPPRDIDDSWLVDDILEAIPLMAQETPVLCITGGEPTLAGGRFLDVVETVKLFLPDTALHVLSNGRTFSNLKTARSVAELMHHDLMIGIPLYSDVASIHNFVVQDRDAFDQTILGFLNLARCGVQTECRIVIHKQTIARLAATARFIARNLPFVSQVALMGLEMTGYTRSNLEALWIDPFDYQHELKEAVFELNSAGIPSMIYNHPLCVLPEELWPFAKTAISDWKNIFPDECEGCAARSHCGGFFASSELRRTAHIAPFQHFDHSAV